MSICRIAPDLDIYESYSISQGFDTGFIISDMTLWMARLAPGGGAEGIQQKIQHSDVDDNEQYVDHRDAPANYLGANSIFIRLGRCETRRWIRIVTTRTGDDPLFMATAILEW